VEDFDGNGIKFSADNDSLTAIAKSTTDEKREHVRDFQFE